MDQSQRQPRPSAVDRINSGVDAAKRARTAYKLARAAGTAAEVVSTSEIWIPIAVVVAIILIFVFIILLKGGGGGIGLGNEESGSGEGPGSGNTSSCQFTRAGQGHSIKSSALARWINEAANSVGIPPSVLASVAMHESQNFLASYDDNSPEIRNDYYCESEGVSCTSIDRSDSLGLGECTQQHIQADIYRGGSGRVITDRHRGLLQISDYFNPTIDACKITASLAWAANKLKVDGVTAQPIQDQINIAVGRYHGSCDYGSYSYCNEVWQDYQSCQASNIVAPPISGDKRQAIIDRFNITMNGFDDQHLDWVWEKLWEVSNTNFTTLIRGAKIQKADGLSQQVGCFGETSLLLGQYVPKDFFKFIFTHELGHVIQACRPQRETMVLQQIDAYFRDGAISEYARDTSRCFPGWHNELGEDYADMIAYYLNSSAGFQSGPASCGLTPNPPNPYLNSAFPFHHNVVKNVIGGL